MLRNLSNQYERCHPLAAGTVAQLDIAARHWDEFFGDREVQQLRPMDLAAFSCHLLESEAAATVNKHRAHLRAVLRWAAENGLIECKPFWDSWKRLKEPAKAPVAFLAEEFQAGLAVAKDWPGWICGVPAGAWWESLLLSIWYSGARIGAMLGVRSRDVLLARNGFYVRWQSQKQKADQFFVVGDDCVEAMKRALVPERDLFWPWPYRREALYRHFRKIFELAGVELGENTGSCFHRIRKSTASYTKAGGGDATGQLGHSCSSVTARYLDPRIVGAHDATSYMPALGR